MKKTISTLIAMNFIIAPGHGIAQNGKNPTTPPAFTSKSMEDHLREYSIKASQRVKLKPAPRLMVGPQQPQPIRGTQDANDSIVYIQIAAGSEKKKWMEWAATEWLKTNPKTRKNKNIVVNIDSIGSIQSGRSVRDGNQPGYTVWSPASSIFREIVESSYRDPVFDTDTTLLQSPLVVLTRKNIADRMSTIIVDENNKTKRMSFNTLVEIIDREQAKEIRIAENGEWFKFGMTNPLASNSGLMALIISTFEYFSIRGEQGRQRMGERQLGNPGYQKYLAFQKDYYNFQANSTGKLASEISKNLPVYQAVLTYESDGITNINNLKKRNLNDSVVIHYPFYNLVTDHPFYILKHNTAPEQREAARMFLEFLLTEEIQREAMLTYGFRPGSPEVSDEETEEHFEKYKSNGLIYDVREVSQLIPTQSGTIIEAILALWEQLEPNDDD